MWHFTDASGQGLLQLEELALAFVLCAMVGLEREVRHKSAGLRTNTVVGLSAALFMLVSKYGFMDVLAPERVVVDPSRVAAQIVSGIGFIGGGVIFMRRDAVRGLTTAASVWLTAGLGMACGAGLPLLAVAATAGHFTIMYGLPKVRRLLPDQPGGAVTLQVTYEDGRGLLRSILVACTSLRFAIDRVAIDRDGAAFAREEALDLADREGTEPEPSRHEPPQHGSPQHGRHIVLSMNVKGKRPISHLIARLAGIDGVVEVGTAEDDPSAD